MKIRVMMLIITGLILSGCGKEVVLEEKMPEAKKYSINEVANHNSESDCWLVISDKVYEVTEFVTSHPGGQALLEGCGIDATELFQTRPMGSKTPHSDKAKSLLDKYFIGELVD